MYLDYKRGTYDICQSHNEGILFRHHKDNTEINRGYMLLALEALDFIEKELYNNKK